METVADTGTVMEGAAMVEVAVAMAVVAATAVRTRFASIDINESAGVVSNHFVWLNVMRCFGPYTGVQDVCSWVRADRY